MSSIGRNHIVACLTGRSYWAKLLAACLTIMSALFVRSMDQAVQIDLQQAQVVPVEHNLGYFLQREIEVAARKSGWWNKCYGEVKFTNGDEAHVLPEAATDYVLGGGCHGGGA